MIELLRTVPLVPEWLMATALALTALSFYLLRRWRIVGNPHTARFILMLGFGNMALMYALIAIDGSNRLMNRVIRLELLFLTLALFFYNLSALYRHIYSTGNNAWIHKLRSH